MINKHNYITFTPTFGRRILYLALPIFLFGILSACQKKEKGTNPPIIIKSNTEYLKFNLASANQLTISQSEKNSYSISTTGGDPYIITYGISRMRHLESVVLSFEF